jgi:DNA-binding transcriptional MerR regulator
MTAVHQPITRIVLHRVLHRSSLRHMSAVPDALIDVDPDALFSTPDTCRMARVSFRQLDYWARVGTIEPVRPANGSGSVRRFTGEQVREVAMVGRLRELGVGLDAIDEVLAVVRESAGALVVISPDAVRAVPREDVADAVEAANGAAIVVSPDALRILSADAPADRCKRIGVR